MISRETWGSSARRLSTTGPTLGPMRRCCGAAGSTGVMRSAWSNPGRRACRRPLRWSLHEEALMQVQDEPSLEKPSLYDRLGGVYNIATVVDDLINRVMVDPRLNANPRVDEAHHRVSAAGFKYFVTEMACGAAGGPQTYTGRSMGDSHRHLEITEQEWGAFMDDFQQTLDKFAV